MRVITVSLASLIQVPDSKIILISINSYSEICNSHMVVCLTNLLLFNLECFQTILKNVYTELIEIMRFSTVMLYDIERVRYEGNCWIPLFFPKQRSILCYYVIKSDIIKTNLKVEQYVQLTKNALPYFTFFNLFM